MTLKDQRRRSSFQGSEAYSTVLRASGTFTGREPTSAAYITDLTDYPASAMCYLGLQEWHFMGIVGRLWKGEINFTDEVKDTVVKVMGEEGGITDLS